METVVSARNTIKHTQPQREAAARLRLSEVAASDFGLSLVEDTPDQEDHGLCAPRAAYFTKHGREKSRADFTAFFASVQSWMSENHHLWGHYLGDSGMSQDCYLSCVEDFTSNPMSTWEAIRLAGADLDPILHVCAILLEADIVCVGSGSADFATVFWKEGHPPASAEDIEKVVSPRSGHSPDRVVILQDAAGLHCYGTCPGAQNGPAGDGGSGLTLALDFSEMGGAGSGAESPEYGGAAADLEAEAQASLLHCPDRTCVPMLEQGDRLLCKEEVAFALRQEDWIGCLTSRADQVLFKFGPEGWFVGSNLQEGKDTQSKRSLVVTYDDGDRVAHSEFDLELFGATYWFVGRLETSAMRRSGK